MMPVLRSLLALSTLAIATCAGGDDGLVRLELEVPVETATSAAARAAGDEAAPAPILVLENVEIDDAERLRLVVLGPPADDGERPELGRAALVGSGDGTPSGNRIETTLVIPLNDAGCRVVAGQEQVELALRVDGDPQRPPLRFESVRLEPP